MDGNDYPESYSVILLLFSINVMTNERREQKKIYEELLSEYRKLVRMNLVAENDARLKERNTLLEISMIRLDID